MTRQTTSGRIRFRSPTVRQQKVGDEPHSVAAVHPSGNFVGKRPARADDGPAESKQSTLKVNPEAPGWTKKLLVLRFFFLIVHMFSL
jgi:hypothetical protein